MFPQDCGGDRCLPVPVQDDNSGQPLGEGMEPGSQALPVPYLSFQFYPLGLDSQPAAVGRPGAFFLLDHAPAGPWPVGLPPSPPSGSPDVMVVRVLGELFSVLFGPFHEPPLPCCQVLVNGGVVPPPPPATPSGSAFMARQKLQIWPEVFADGSPTSAWSAAPAALLGFRRRARRTRRGFPTGPRPVWPSFSCRRSRGRVRSAAASGTVRGSFPAVGRVPAGSCWTVTRGGCPLGGGPLGGPWSSHSLASRSQPWRTLLAAGALLPDVLFSHASIASLRVAPVSWRYSFTHSRWLGFFAGSMCSGPMCSGPTCSRMAWASFSISLVSPVASVLPLAPYIFQVSSFSLPGLACRLRPGSVPSHLGWNVPELGRQNALPLACPALVLQCHGVVPWPVRMLSRALAAGTDEHGVPVAAYRQLRPVIPRSTDVQTLLFAESAVHFLFPSAAVSPPGLLRVGVFPSRDLALGKRDPEWSPLVVSHALYPCCRPGPPCGSGTSVKIGASSTGAYRSSRSSASFRSLCALLSSSTSRALRWSCSKRSIQ